MGAGDGNRTHVYSLEGCHNSHYTTPAKIFGMVGASRFELELNPPKGLVLPLHYAPPVNLISLCFLLVNLMIYSPKTEDNPHH